MAVLQSNRTGNMLPGLIGQPRDGVRYAELNAKPDTRLSGAFDALADGAADLGKAYFSLKAASDRVSKQQQAVSLNDAANYYQARIDQEIAGCYGADGTLDVGKAQTLNASVTDGIMQETLSRFPNVTAERLRDKTLAWQTNRMTKFSTAIKQQSHLNFGASKNIEAEKNIRLFTETGDSEALVNAYGCLRDAVNDGYATDDAAQPYLTATANEFVTGNSVDFLGISRMSINPGETFENDGHTITVIADDAKILDRNTQIPVSKLRDLITLKAQKLAGRRQETASEMSKKMTEVAVPLLINKATATNDVSMLKTLLQLADGDQKDNFNLTPGTRNQINAVIDSVEAHAEANVEFQRITDKYKTTTAGNYSETSMAGIALLVAEAKVKLQEFPQGSYDYKRQAALVNLLEKKEKAMQARQLDYTTKKDEQNEQLMLAEIAKLGMSGAIAWLHKADPSGANPCYAAARAIIQGDKTAKTNIAAAAKAEQEAKNGKYDREAYAALTGAVAQRVTTLKEIKDKQDKELKGIVAKELQELDNLEAEETRLRQTIMDIQANAQTTRDEMFVGNEFYSTTRKVLSPDEKQRIKEAEAKLKLIPVRRKQIEDKANKSADELDRSMGNQRRTAEEKYDATVGVLFRNSEAGKTLPAEEQRVFNNARASHFRQIELQIIMARSQGLPVRIGGKVFPVRSDDELRQAAEFLFAPDEIEDRMKTIQKYHRMYAKCDDTVCKIISMANDGLSVSPGIASVVEPEMMYSIVSRAMQHDGASEADLKGAITRIVAQELLLKIQRDDEGKITGYVDSTEDANNNDLFKRLGRVSQERAETGRYIDIDSDINLYWKWKSER